MSLETLFWYLACIFGYRGEGQHGRDACDQMQVPTVLPTIGQVNHTCVFLLLSLKKPKVTSSAVGIYTIDVLS